MSLEVGRCLDALVAEKVFGCRVLWLLGDACCNCEGLSHSLPGRHNLPEYSTDISAAMDVLCKARGKDGHFQILSHPDGIYRCYLFHVDERPMSRGEGKTISEAICRAALAARGA